MDAELKQKWVNALRSGEYVQGKDYLKAGGCFCCLGVLAEIKGVPSQFSHSSGEETPRGIYKYDFGTNKEFCYPPYYFCKLGPTTIHKLSNMNDDGKSFTEIADWIEENL